MLTHGKKVCNPFWGSVISRKSIDIYRYALTGWGEEWGTIGVIWPCVNGIVSAMSVRKGGWNLENGVSSTSLLGCCHEVRRVLPYQCSQAGTLPWCVVSGLTVVCAWDTEPVSLFGRPPEYLN
jgi:hypothetical protein